MILLAPVLLLYEWFHIRSNWGFAFLVFCVLVLLGIYRMLGWIGRPYQPPLDSNSPHADNPLPAIVLDERNPQSDPARQRGATDGSGCRAPLIWMAIVGLICALACGGVIALVTWKAWQRIHHGPPAPRFGTVSVARLNQPYSASSDAVLGAPLRARSNRP
jgi:hypothetical protein